MRTLLSFFALWLISVFGASNAAALEITEETHGNYLEYLKTIGSAKRGAFAVSPDGYYSFYMYCEQVNCIADNLGRDALTKCATLSGQKCSLMAYGRDLRIPFEVVALTSEPNEEILANILNAQQLKQMAVGNTMRGEYMNGQQWVEFYDPSGDIRGMDEEQGTYNASYSLKGDQICFDYPGTNDDWCAQISMRGNRVDYLHEGKVVNFIKNTVFENGNPQGL